MHSCQESIGYLFRRGGLLRKALTHSSVKDEKHPSNERLEFLGDAILGMVISEYLFSMLPENDEGDLTKVKSVVVSSQTLSRLGLEMGLDRYLLIGKGIRLKKEIPRSLIANAVEAVIAAVYLDRGMEAARHFVLDHLHSYVEEVLTDRHEEKNYKSLLQQRAQKDLSGTPVYKVIAEQGPDHSKSFRVSAVVNGREFPIGSGASKKEAEQEAARIALASLDGDRGQSRRKPRRKSARDSNGQAPAPESESPSRSRERRREEPESERERDRDREPKRERGRARSAKQPAKRSRRKSEKTLASEPAAETERKPRAKRKPEPEKKPRIRRKPDAKRKPERKAKPESKRKPEPKRESEPKRKPEAKRKSEPKRKPEAKAKPARKPAKKPSKKLARAPESKPPRRPVKEVDRSRPKPRSKGDGRRRGPRSSSSSGNR